jgi:DNA-binding beta-propeller fold protein YncE
LTRGKEAGGNAPLPKRVRNHSSHPADREGHGLEPPKPGDLSCSPTWASTSVDGSMIYVACNKSSEIVEVDAKNWRVTRRIEAGPGVYNLEVTNDGRLIVTNKRGPSVSVYDLKSGKELARIPTKHKVVHGVVVSPDDRYAFVSVEGVGSEPGTVEIIDLAQLKSTAVVDVAQQAAGIDFFKIEPVKRRE